MPTFTDLARAAYCPRQLYYTRRDDDRGPSPEARERIDLAFRYPELRAADEDALATEPIDRSPAAYRTALDRLAARDDWADLTSPDARRVRLEGRDCRGVVHKVIEGPEDGRVDREDGTECTSRDDGGDGGGEVGDDGGDAPEAEPNAGDSGGAPTPVIVSPGAPPDCGVWEPQSVRAVAAALALAWERERAVPRALVEYPASGVVREVRLTTRRRAAYRRTLRTVRAMDGPPARLGGSEKCEACDYRTECGVKTRSLRSLLGR